MQTRRHFAARVQVPVAIAEEGRGRRVDRAVRMDILHAEAVRCGAVRCGAVRCGAARCGAVRRSAVVRRGAVVGRGAVRASRRMLGMSTMVSSGYGGP